MPNQKGILQKTSLISAYASFVLAIISAVILYLRIDTWGGDNPITASFMASTFFFVAVGVVLTIIGKADLPSFKLNDPDQK